MLQMNVVVYKIQDLNLKLIIIQTASTDVNQRL